MPKHILLRKRDEAIVIAGCIFITVKETWPGSVHLEISVHQDVDLQTDEPTVSRLKQIQMDELAEDLVDPRLIVAHTDTALELTGNISVIVLECTENKAKLFVKTPLGVSIQRREIWEVIRPQPRKNT